MMDVLAILLLEIFAFVAGAEMRDETPSSSHVFDSKALDQVLVVKIRPDSLYAFSTCQYDSLKLLFDSTNGFYWTWKEIGEVWNFTDTNSDPCINNWQGITCDEYNETISELSLSEYNLSGSLPDEMFDCMQSLKKIDFVRNDLLKTIPASIGYLINLQELSFGFNKLTGTITNSLGQLSNLQVLSICANKLTGTIPDSLGNLTKLGYLNFYDNILNGTIPSSFGKLVNLKDLYGDHNRLSGTIPSTLGKMTALETIVMHNNILTGPIPSSISELKSLRILRFRLNSLNGTIPSVLGFLKSLIHMELQGNDFTGSIPSSIGELTNLVSMVLSVNHLIGSIPPAFGNLSSLVILHVGSNFISGTIPSTIGSLNKLQDLSLRNNHLTGMIPSELGSLSQLVNLDLRNNSMIGPIPESFKDLTGLTHFFANNNWLSGSLPYGLRFNGTFDISSNLFSGRLPSSLFSPDVYLGTFVASQNCLSTKLPSTICSATSLISLILNGIGRNKRCRSDSEGTSTLPSCLFSLPLLQKLYVAGNSFKGNMEHFEAFDLVELNVNSNKLFGTLSANLSKARLDIFDVGRNHFSGFLNFNISNRPQSTEDSVQTIFKADINRISGFLDSESINMFSYVSVLDGNMISCATLPSKDVLMAKGYDCETSNLLISISMWSAVAGFVSLALLVNCIISWKYMSPTSLLRNIYEEFRRTDRLETHLQKRIQEFALMSVSVAFVAILATVSFYSGFEFNVDSDLTYKTHYEKYNYAISGVLMMSEGPVVGLLAIYSILSSLVVYGVFRIFVLNNFVDENKIVESPIVESPSKMFSVISLRYFLVLLHVGISLGMNFGYIYSLSFGGNVLLFEVCFAFANFVHSNYVTRFLLSTFFEEDSMEMRREKAVVYGIVSACFEIINPSIATLFFDSLCFKEYYFPPDPISSSYSYPSCSLYLAGTLNCLVPATGTATTDPFQPLFMYSNQCRNAIFKNRIPIIIFSSLWSTFVCPLCYFLPILIVENMGYKYLYHLAWCLNLRSLIVEKEILYALRTIIQNLVLILLFGTVYPFCSFVICVDTLSRSYILLYGMRMYAIITVTPSLSQPSLEELCSRCSKNNVYLVWPSLALASIIFGLYLFDCALDSESNDILIPTVIFVLNIVIFTILCFIFFYSKKHLRPAENRDDSLTLNPIYTTTNPLASQQCSVLTLSLKSRASSPHGSGDEDNMFSSEQNVWRDRPSVGVSDREDIWRDVISVKL